jgi:hypothetical protein
MTQIYLIDPPTFALLATWQRHLEECRRLPAELKSELIEAAEEALARFSRNRDD